MCIFLIFSLSFFFFLDILKSVFFLVLHQSRILIVHYCVQAYPSLIQNTSLRWVWRSWLMSSALTMTPPCRCFRSATRSDHSCCFRHRTGDVTIAESTSCFGCSFYFLLETYWTISRCIKKLTFAPRSVNCTKQATILKTSQCCETHIRYHLSSL